MTGFEPRTSDGRNDHCANCVTAIALFTSPFDKKY